MAVLTSPSELSQGQETIVSDIVFTVPGTGADATITSSGNELPVLTASTFFEIRNHNNSQNNGLYQVVTVNSSTASYEVDKVSGAAPVTAGSQSVATLGSSNSVSTMKNIFYDTAALKIYLLEQGTLTSDGVTGQAIYSHAKDTWKDDSFIIANAPFPLVTIDADAGKFEIGTDGTNNNGFNWQDNNSFSIRTRKLIRNAGWNERDSTGIIKSRYFGAITLGQFEDPVNDVAYYQFGNDTTTDDTVDFDFAGPVNEAVQFYQEIGNPTGLDFTGATSITRSSGSFIDDGYKVGGQVTIRNATNSSNNGTYYLLSVDALVMEASGATFTTGADSNGILAVNNGNGVTLRIRIRDGDSNGKTFSQANLASAGRTQLSNFIFSFPLANATDLDISADDNTIDTTAPYTGMSITYYDTPQQRSGLVGGTYNFGIIIDGNNGTNQQVYEWVQRQLRKTTDIDADSSIAIGRTMDGLMRFVGSQLQVGSSDGGLTYPRNPDGGGSGVYIDNLNAASRNDVLFFDNLGTQRFNPETIAVTIDFNSTIVDDSVAEFDLFYDRTIRTVVSDFVVSASTSNYILSAGGNLPSNSEITVNKYVRIEGLTGVDNAMNGVYQITAIDTAGQQWQVVRYDGATIVTTSSASVNLDQNCIDTPDAIIVHTNIVTGNVTDIAFAAPNIINSSGSTDLSVFGIGDIIEVIGSTSNDGYYTVTGTSLNTLSVEEQTIVVEATGSTVYIAEAVSGIANADYVFSYDFDGNTQGGRTVSTTTFVKAKAIGQSGSQYAESTVQSIVTGTPLTIPVVGQVERNYSA